MVSQKIKSYLRTLSQNPEHVDLFFQANQLNKMAQVIGASNIIPAHLFEYCRLGPLSQGKLTLLAENAAIATKLKHLSPSILLKLQQKGWKITALKIQLLKPDNINHTNNLATATASKPITKKPQLSRAGIENLDHLARSLPDSALKNSIKSLLKKHANNQA